MWVDGVMQVEGCALLVEGVIRVERVTVSVEAIGSLCFAEP